MTAGHPPAGWDRAARLVDEGLAALRSAARAWRDTRRPPDFWVDARCARSCYACEVAFGLVTRKHHCRACGRVFCARCSSKTSWRPRASRGRRRVRRVPRRGGGAPARGVPAGPRAGVGRDARGRGSLARVARGTRGGSPAPARRRADAAPRGSAAASSRPRKSPDPSGRRGSSEEEEEEEEEDSCVFGTTNRDRDAASSESNVRAPKTSANANANANANLRLRTPRR